MTTIRKSYKDKTIDIAAGSKGNSLGYEFAGIIQNDPANYAKTGEWKILMPKVSAACLACRMCVQNCPEAAIDIKKIDSKNRADIDYNYCKGCSICAEICPVKAIKMENGIRRG